CCSSIHGHRAGISSWAPSSACRRCCWWLRRWRSACCSSIHGHRAGISSWAPSSACRRCCWWLRRWR
ncbi:hypothetical protein C7E13_22070, partial [Stenotrophomonas maltophilia]